MKRPGIDIGAAVARPLAPVCAVLLALAVLAVGAQDAIAAEAPPPAPAPTSTPPPAAPVASGSMKLVLQDVGGQPTFALAGRRIVVRGIVSPTSAVRWSS